MLPDWDFGGDEAKRRAFITWVEAELDRLAGLLHDRHATADVPEDWKALAMRHVLKSGRNQRPEKPHDGWNVIVWEYELVRFIFRRYWPKRKRPTDDPASALRIAVNRGRRGVRREDRSPHRLQAHRENAADLVGKLQAELKRSTPSAGRREAAADIAYLDTLPASHFAR